MMGEKESSALEEEEEKRVRRAAASLNSDPPTAESSLLGALLPLPKPRLSELPNFELKCVSLKLQKPWSSYLLGLHAEDLPAHGLRGGPATP